MQKIGFIGLGIMGKPMAKNLMKGGYSLVVCDIIKSFTDDLASHGATVASSPAEVASLCKTIITMLPNGPEVKQVVTGKNGILEGIQEGSVIIDMSSIAPLVSKEMYLLCKEKKARFMDAPVSGGEPKAIEGTLAIMVGCDREADFEPQLPLLKKMGASVVRTGDIGSGNVTKLVNQVIVALNIAALIRSHGIGNKGRR